MHDLLALTIKNKNEVLYLRLDNVLYIQADGNYSNIYLADGGVINTLTYQRAEIVRMPKEQLPTLDHVFTLSASKEALKQLKIFMESNKGKEIRL